ncbi:hypothetical protein H112_03557 [Trichophyton rubrum D6]|uniref:Uncharacterized protein n=2 Tax=Trichophyton TaxID=5550 RepID=A0A022W560_TRIRU|nr:hypothetical protein H100_03563 [Trichophyton rubrum MR850]EZF42843.1 hypothetical protein H102_03556 [Trichophyton rubrum CBS 100081]EZF53472.1 hypothetical protein H103_03566 [Trichophyton rubrum CBS 288.86]EZF64090.1 hypothetical protein H104_03553 [Trichophyton rubrum CBS 289.86]EZF74741.1 hypothetical protein H105_03579 [Trichophyton soudanense CBS 452.61]EZF85457.1 hypothetical protein H110_03564 [Trichophyton rubrum MR1448]EZF96234.1 hypothetical protein H113_03584 [Trichophyton rub
METAPTWPRQNVRVYNIPESNGVCEYGILVSLQIAMLVLSRFIWIIVIIIVNFERTTPGPHIGESGNQFESVQALGHRKSAILSYTTDHPGRAS